MSGGDALRHELLLVRWLFGLNISDGIALQFCLLLEVSSMKQTGCAWLHRSTRGTRRR